MCVHMGIETVGILAHTKNRPRQAHTYGNVSIYICVGCLHLKIYFLYVNNKHY